MKKIFIYSISILLVLLSLYLILCKWCDQINIYTYESKLKGPVVLMIGGTHGNEPAGTHAIEEVMKHLKLKKGTLILVPRANKLGLYSNSRWLVHKIRHRDLNRNYPRTPDDFPKCNISRTLVNQIEKADFVLDFHEGIGYAIKDSYSIGSGLYPTNTSLAKSICKPVLDELNSSISDENKRFVTFELSHIQGTLRCYCDSIKKPYILVETTGQYNVQPLHIRVKQDKIIINKVLTLLDMV